MPAAPSEKSNKLGPTNIGNINIATMDLISLNWTVKSFRDTVDFIDSANWGLCGYSVCLVESKLFIFKKNGFGQYTTIAKIAGINEGSPYFENVFSIGIFTSKIIWDISLQRFIAFVQDSKRSRHKAVYFGDYHKTDVLVK